MIKCRLKRMDYDKDIKYPCIMEGADGLIVLFHKEGHGQVLLGDSDGKCGTGEYSRFWAMNVFKPFVGEITLISII